MPRYVRSVVFLFFSLCASGDEALAHELRHEESTASSAVVIRILHHDNTPFSFESYEILPENGPGDGKNPVQTGRTDRNGRVAFVADRAGRWRFKAFSGDGHGVAFTFRTNAASVLTGSDRPLIDRHARLFAGLGILFAVFGALAVFQNQRLKKGLKGDGP